MSKASLYNITLLLEMTYKMKWRITYITFNAIWKLTYFGLYQNTLLKILLDKVKLETRLLYSTVFNLWIWWHWKNRKFSPKNLSQYVAASMISSSELHLGFPKKSLTGCQVTAFKQSQKVSVMKEIICFYLMAQLQQQQCKLVKYKEK